MKQKCPSCGFKNIHGADGCELCLHSLTQRDIPRPKKNDTFQQVIMTAPISDLLTGSDLLVARPTDTIKKTVAILKKEKKSCILIYDDGKLVGILSNRDLLNKVAGKHKDLSKLKIKEIMTKNPEFVRAEDPIAYAVNKMAMGYFRHLPILATDGAPLSIISIKDVLSYLSKRNHTS